jgi:hypothetical protein
VHTAIVRDSNRPEWKLENEKTLEAPFQAEK